MLTLVQLQLLPVQGQAAVAAGRGRIAADLQVGRHPGQVRVQVEAQVHPVDQELGRAIVLQTDRVRGVSVHAALGGPWQGTPADRVDCIPAVAIRFQGKRKT